MHVSASLDHCTRRKFDDEWQASSSKEPCGRWSWLHTLGGDHPRGARTHRRKTPLRILLEIMTGEQNVQGEQNGQATEAAALCFFAAPLSVCRKSRQCSLVPSSTVLRLHTCKPIPYVFLITKHDLVVWIALSPFFRTQVQFSGSMMQCCKLRVTDASAHRVDCKLHMLALSRVNRSQSC